LVRLVLAALAGVLGVMMKRPQLALGVVASGVFFCFLQSGFRALDVLSTEWEGPVPSFARFAALSGKPIVVYHMRKPSITFYALRKVLIPPGEAELFETVKAYPDLYIIGKRADLLVLSKLPECRVLVLQGRFVLMRRLAIEQH
jgi:hypothetical protein